MSFIFGLYIKIYIFIYLLTKTKIGCIFLIGGVCLRDIPRKLAEVLFDNKVCRNCKGFLEADLAYCMTCGKENPDFDLLDSEVYLYETLEEAQEKECPEWHKVSGIPNSESQSFKDIEEFPFCPWCGKKVITFNLN
jgi:RNA polymerase subunit RPABC4/transcription elongation factor Spt4